MTEPLFLRMALRQAKSEREKAVLRKTAERAFNILDMTPDGGASLDRALAEAEARGMERAAKVADTMSRAVEQPDKELGMTHRGRLLLDPARIAAAIRAHKGKP